MTVPGQMIRALVKAHYARDMRMFRALTVQRVARLRDAGKQREADDLEKLIQTETAAALAPLPQAVQGLVWPLPGEQRHALLFDGEPQDAFHEVAQEWSLVGRELLAEHGLSPVRSLLLHGPSGVGKTAFARALGVTLGRPTYAAALPSVVSSHLGETAGNLAKIIDAAASMECILVLDEIDSLGGQRGRGAGNSADRERDHTVNSILMLLDRLAAEQHPALLVATTNRLDLLDPALVRRFDRTISFGLPDAPTRAALAVLHGPPDYEPEGESHAEVISAALRARRRWVLSRVPKVNAA